MTLTEENSVSVQRSPAWLARARREGAALLSAQAAQIAQLQASRSYDDQRLAALLQTAHDSHSKAPEYVRGIMKVNVAYRHVADGLHASACYKDAQCYAQVYGEQALTDLKQQHTEQLLDEEGDDLMPDSPQEDVLRSGTRATPLDSDYCLNLEAGHTYDLNLSELRGVVPAQHNRFPFTALSDARLEYQQQQYPDVETLAQAVRAQLDPAVFSGQGRGPLDEARG